MGEKTKKKGSISYAKWGYIFIAPFFLIFAVFQLIPLASTIYYSFFEYYRSGLKIIGPNFVGLKNYVTLFATDLPKYFSNTLLLWIIGFIPQIAISLLLAAWFTDLRLKLKGQTFFKTVIYMPNLIMASAFAMLFFALFSDNGPVNAALMGMGILKQPFSFLNTVWGNRGLIGLMNFLMWFGNTTIMLMAAIMGVGGGFVTFPMFVYIFGVSSMTTVGTDILQIIFTAGLASVGQYAIYGYVFYTLAVGMLLGSLLGIQVGALTTKVVKGVHIRGFYAVSIISGFINRAATLPKKLVEMEYLDWSMSVVNIIEEVGNVIFWVVVAFFGLWVFSKFFLNLGKLRGEA
mgnify:CR=1 FL=1